MKYFKLILVTLCFSILCACGASKSIKEQPDTTFESQATEKPSIDLDDNNEVSSESYVNPGILYNESIHTLIKEEEDVKLYKDEEDNSIYLEYNDQSYQLMSNEFFTHATIAFIDLTRDQKKECVITLTDGDGGTATTVFIFQLKNEQLELLELPNLLDSNISVSFVSTNEVVVKSPNLGIEESMAVDTSDFENYTAELLNQSLTRGVSYSSVSLDQENFSMNIDRWIYLGSPSSTIGILHYELIYNEKDKSYEVQNISFVS